MEIKAKDFNKINFKFFRTVIFIFERIMFVASMILAGSLLVISFIPKRLFELSGKGLSNFGIEMGNTIRLNLDLSSVGSFNIKLFVLEIIFVSLLLLVVAFFITRSLRQIFDTLVEKNPFHEHNSKRIAHMGILLIVLSALSSLPEVIFYSVIHQLVELNYLEVVYSIDDGLFFSGILVILLASIFKYGTFLQNEYDSTL